MAKILNIKVRVVGSPGGFKGGLIVGNHMGYLDLFIHASLFPIRFAAKAELKKWPILGPYLSISRSVWVDRSSRQKSKEVERQFVETMEHGIPLLVYPEGTSSDGEHGILPFKSTPFSAAAGKDFPILPILIFYDRSDDGGELAWYGDMNLLSHVWRILGYKELRAEAHILPVILPGNRTRKELASHVHSVMEKEYWRIKKVRQVEATKN